MDPRVKVTPLALRQQLALARRLAAALRTDSTTLGDVRGFRSQLEGLKGRTTDSLHVAIESLDAAIAVLERGGGPRGGDGESADNLARLIGEMAALYGDVEDADVAPTLRLARAVAVVEQRVAALTRQWQAIRRDLVPPLNARLKEARLTELSRLDGTPGEEDFTEAEDAVGEQEP